MPSRSGNTETSRTIIVRLTVDTHKALRIRVAEEDTSIQKWVENLVEREFELPDSPYGTFDQGGNVWEWNEAIRDGSGLLGGEASNVGSYLLASCRDY